MSFPIADAALPPHPTAMREPIGTTRKGQLLLGSVGLVVGVGGGLGLVTKPETFEPILELLFYVLRWVLRTPLYYDPSQRTSFAILLPVFGIVWALLFAYAFAREPARNRAIDAYLLRQDGFDKSRRSTVISQNDRPV
jgi:hypothetical protein